MVKGVCEFGKVFWLRVFLWSSHLEGCRCTIVFITRVNENLARMKPKLGNVI